MKQVNRLLRNSNWILLTYLLLGQLGHMYVSFYVQYILQHQYVENLKYFVMGHDQSIIDVMLKNLQNLKALPNHLMILMMNSLILGYF